MSGGKSKAGLWKTLWNALVLDANFYENARNEPRIHRLALSIVILAAVSRGFGSLVIAVINLAPLPIVVLALLANGLSIVGGYYFWTFTIWKLGQWLKRDSPAAYGDLLGPIGFAYAPQVLNFLTLIPLLGQPIERVLAVWSLLTVIVGVRQGLDISTARAALISLVGWPIIQIAIGFLQVFDQVVVVRNSRLM